MKIIWSRKISILVMIVLMICSLTIIATPNTDDIYFGYISSVESKSLDSNGNKPGYGIKSFIEYRGCKYRIGLVDPDSEIGKDNFIAIPNNIGTGSFSDHHIYFCIENSVYEVHIDESGRPSSFSLVDDNGIYVSENNKIRYKGFSADRYVFSGYGDDNETLKIKIIKDSNAKVEIKRSKNEIVIDLPASGHLTSKKINKEIKK